MLCKTCGQKLNEAEKICTKCGASVAIGETTKTISTAQEIVKGKWWFRLANVIYIILHLPLLVLIPIVWNDNSSEYLGNTINGAIYNDTFGEAFLYSLITLVIYLFVARLVKITFLYIAFGQKPVLRKEFRKFF